MASKPKFKSARRVPKQKPHPYACLVSADLHRFGLVTGPGEDRADYLRRCILAVAGLSDAEWHLMTEWTQAWHNEAVDWYNRYAKKEEAPPIPDYRFLPY